MRIARKLSHNYLENQNKQLTLNNLNNNNGVNNDTRIPVRNNKKNDAILQDERKVSKRS